MSLVISQSLQGFQLWLCEKLGGQFFPADRQPMKFLLRFQIGRATALIFSLCLSFFLAFLKGLVVQPRPAALGAVC